MNRRRKRMRRNAELVRLRRESRMAQLRALLEAGDVTDEAMQRIADTEGVPIELIESELAEVEWHRRAAA